MPSIAIWLSTLVVYILSVTGGYFVGRADGRKLERGIQDRARVEALQQQQQDFKGKVDAQAAIAETARQQAEKNAADRDAAVDAADGLRRARDAAVARARQCSATAGGGQAASDPAGMLGRVFEESVRRNQALARYADDLRNAITACVGSYETLGGKP